MFIRNCLFLAVIMFPSWAYAGPFDSKPTGTSPYILKENEKRPLVDCRASGCRCPAGTRRVEFWEAEGHVSNPKMTMSCVKRCSESGKIQKKLVSLAGRTSFICATPGGWK